MNLELVALMFKISEGDEIRREIWIKEQQDAPKYQALLKHKSEVSGTNV